MSYMYELVKALNLNLEFSVDVNILYYCAALQYVTKLTSISLLNSSSFNFCSSFSFNTCLSVLFFLVGAATFTKMYEKKTHECHTIKYEGVKLAHILF